jgi:Kyakuja-Dileera-Zisupton transposase
MDHDLGKAIYNCLEMYIEVVDTGYKRLINRIRQLLRQIFASESILQLVPFGATGLLEFYAKDHLNSKLAPNIPAFGMIIQNLRAAHEPRVAAMLEPRLKVLAHQLALQSQSVFRDLILQRTVIIQGNPNAHGDHHQREWEITGCFYGRELQRVRPFYEGRDNDKSVQAEQVCQKYYEIYKKDKLTGGLMALWCPHLVCLGFHKMPKAEGRNDVFSAILSYFETAPSVVIYDFACQLAPYCRSREPEFFKDTLFVIDEMHAKGHSSCSQACFLSNYMQTRPDLLPVNSSAAECSNSGLNRIRKSVSYMNEANAILYTHTFLSVWNRRRERGFQKEADEQAQKFEAVYEKRGNLIK